MTIASTPDHIDLPPAGTYQRRVALATGHRPVPADHLRTDARAELRRDDDAGVLHAVATVHGITAPLPLDQVHMIRGDIRVHAHAPGAPVRVKPFPGAVGRHFDVSST